MSDAVAKLVVALRDDSSGDPAVYVTVVFRTEGARKAWPRRSEIERHVREVLQRVVPERWPYVGFSAEDEALNPESPTP